MEIAVQDTIRESADAVWERIRSFGTIHSWFPPATDTTVEGEGLGAVRTLHMDDGSTIKERLESLDDDTYTLTYSIADKETPFRDYLSTLKVRSDRDDTAELIWSATLDPTIPEDEARDILENMYAAGIQELKEQLES